MIIPEKNKDVKSIKIPRLLFRSILFFAVSLAILVGILTYDYWNVLSQVYENKHLLVENRQLKEQVQLFQMKLNTIANDLERINVFERKLRNISGLESIKPASFESIKDDRTSYKKGIEIGEPDKDVSSNSMIRIFNSPETTLLTKFKELESDPKFIELKVGHEEKISKIYMEDTELQKMKDWTLLTRQSLKTAILFAEFDYKNLVVSEYIKDLEDRLNQLDQHLLDKESFLRSTPTLMPAYGHISSGYGPRMSPYAQRIKMHEGIDIGAPVGTTIVAPADGVITFSGAKPGFGNFVQIDHGYGVETIFGHASTLNVKKGQKIYRGDKIAAVGNTGYSTGPHVHYEVRVNGTPVDPLYYMLN